MRLLPLFDDDSHVSFFVEGFSYLLCRLAASFRYTFENDLVADASFNSLVLGCQFYDEEVEEGDKFVAVLSDCRAKHVSDDFFDCILAVFAVDLLDFGESAGDEPEGHGLAAVVGAVFERVEGFVAWKFYGLG